MKAFVPQLAWIENRAAADKAPAIKVVAVESFPEDSDAAARNGDHDIRKQDGGHEQCRQQSDRQTRQVAPNKTPPGARPGWHSIKGLRVLRHQSFSRYRRLVFVLFIVRWSTIFPSSIRILRAGKSSSSR